MEPEAGNFAIELVYNWGKDDGYEGGERFGHFAFEMEDIDAVLPVIELFGGRVTRLPYMLEGRRPEARVHRRPGRQRDRADRALTRRRVLTRGGGSARGRWPRRRRREGLVAAQAQP